MTDRAPHKIRKSFDTSQPPRQAAYTASLPGHIEVSLLAWLRCLSPREYIPKLLLSVFFLGILLAVHPASPNQAQGLSILCGIFAAVSALSIFNKLGLERRRFSGGCLCSAVVVSLNPPLVAVSTDLSKVEGETWPVIKILPQPLYAVKGPQLQVGDRLPAVSLYHSGSAMAMSVREATGLKTGDFDKPYWYDFALVIVQCITDDPAVVQNAMRRLSESGDVWTELQAGLAQVPQPYRPGLYRIRQE